MDKIYNCYCGLCCINCPVKAKVEPAAKMLYNEMQKTGFEEIIGMIPGGDGFWPFLKSMVTEGLCGSCQDGQSGNPACEVRICARGKGIEMCALCNDYPCEKFDDFFKLYPTLKQDNELLREQGMDAWLKLQEERRAAGGTCLDGK